ncbi:MAG TPA: CoA-binding protein [Burkholderiales bacterium]
MFTNPDDDARCALLRQVRTIAVVGLSPNPSRPSHRIARALKARGYRIIPVRPLVSEVLGEKAYARLDEIGDKIDLVNVFRSADYLGSIVDECLRLNLSRLWIQEGIVNEEAAARACAGGIEVVMDRCILRDLDTVCA